MDYCEATKTHSWAFSGRQRNFNGERLWARGYAVSTVGFQEEQVRAYIRNQEQLDNRENCEEEGSFLVIGAFEALQSVKPID